MKSHIVAALAFCCIVMFTGCLSSRIAASLTFQWPQVVGPYSASITRDDIHQIVDLAVSRSDIKKPVDQIDTERPDEAYVKGGNPQNTGDQMTSFDVRKKNGRWKIIEKSVNTGPAIITS
ncbi:MAG: hypothetical protein QOC70_219 [Verrucomicrobiota bacterium]|jgi:hypothetical protein